MLAEDGDEIAPARRKVTGIDVQPLPAPADGDWTVILKLDPKIREWLLEQVILARFHALGEMGLGKRMRRPAIRPMARPTRKPPARRNGKPRLPANPRGRDEPGLAVEAARVAGHRRLMDGGDAEVPGNLGRRGRERQTGTQGLGAAPGGLDLDEDGTKQERDHAGNQPGQRRVFLHPVPVRRASDSRLAPAIRRSSHVVSGLTHRIAATRARCSPQAATPPTPRATANATNFTPMPILLDAIVAGRAPRVR